jgi:hypothetical protein
MLNTLQQQAFEELQDFMLTKDLTYTISGGPGTGKTYLINEFLKNIGQHIHVCVVAPTHKALSLLKGSVSARNIEYYTLHKFLGLIDPDDIEDKEQNNNDNDNDHGFAIRSRTDLLIIDEASMVGAELLQEFLQKSKHKKIILGDVNQLEPVPGAKDVSLIKNSILLAKPNVILTDQMRASSFLDDLLSPYLNAIRFTLTEYNKVVSSLSPADIKMIQKKPMDKNEIQLWEEARHVVNGQAEQVCTVAKFNIPVKTASWLDVTKNLPDLDGLKDYTQKIDNFKILAWSNKDVEEYNRKCRSYIFGGNAPVFYTSEPIRITRNFNSINGTKLYNSQIVYAQSFRSYKNFDYYIFENNKRVKYTSTIYKCDIGYGGGNQINTYVILDQHNHTKGMIYTLKNMPEFYEYLYNDNKTYHLPLFVSYFWAETIHKSQGSSYKNVFVSNSFKYSKIGKKQYETNDGLRLQYVAMTRSKDNIYLI